MIFTTLNIYTHITDNMQRSAADKIERCFGRNEGALGEERKEERYHPGRIHAVQAQNTQAWDGLCHDD